MSGSWIGSAQEVSYLQDDYSAAVSHTKGFAM